MEPEGYEGDEHKLTHTSDNLIKDPAYTATREEVNVIADSYNKLKEKGASKGEWVSLEYRLSEYTRELKTADKEIYDLFRINLRIIQEAIYKELTGEDIIID